VRSNLALFGVVTVAIGGLAGLGAYLARPSGLPVEAAAGTVSDALPPKLNHEWILVDDSHWRIVAPPGEDPVVTDAREGNRGRCTPGMIEVSGEMLVDPSKTAAYDGNSVEELQKRACTKWIQREYPERCLEFDRDKWLAISKDLKREPMHYCIDRFEYPNRMGEYPIIYVSYHEAKARCQSEGKRLCSEAEWTFACEGNEGTPYPHGYYRDPDACVQDKRWKAYNETAMVPRTGPAAMAEMDRLWQGVASGSRPKCKSSFGVYDMTGNVDEWSSSVRPGERPSILKGGYWGPVRTRCRPSTRSHDENHAFYQQGFRCCSDVPAARMPRRRAPASGGGSPPASPL
jgi:formylglycine-generating enzyme